MSKMEDIRPVAVIDLAVLNAAAVTIAQLDAADGAGSANIAAGVRRRALERWTALHDPEHLIERAHLLDAAALATLIETGDGAGFDDARFGELVEFVAELPW